jgi:predicted enzyme related to lactoylglutathione lyase
MEEVAAMAIKARVATLIPIRNMNRALKFYTKTLGGKLKYRGEGGMKNLWASLEIGGADLWLIAPQRREARTLAYTTLLVKNIKSVVKQLKAKNVKFKRAERMSKKTKIDGPIAIEEFGASAFFKDTEGNLLMIWQNFPSM